MTQSQPIVANPSGCQGERLPGLMDLATGLSRNGGTSLDQRIRAVAAGTKIGWTTPPAGSSNAVCHPNARDIELRPPGGPLPPRPQSADCPGPDGSSRNGSGSGKLGRLGATWPRKRKSSVPDTPSRRLLQNRPK